MSLNRLLSLPACCGRVDSHARVSGRCRDRLYWVRFACFTSVPPGRFQDNGLSLWVLHSEPYEVRCLLPSPSFDAMQLEPLILSLYKSWVTVGCSACRQTRVRVLKNDTLGLGSQRGTCITHLIQQTFNGWLCILQSLNCWQLSTLWHKNSISKAFRCWTVRDVLLFHFG